MLEINIQLRHVANTEYISFSCGFCAEKHVNGFINLLLSVWLSIVAISVRVMVNG